MPLVLLVLALLVARPGAAGAQNPVERISASAGLVQGVLEDSFARALPLPSASGGVSYAFDPATGNFSRQPTTFGQVYLDRAEPLGMGRLNLGFAYVYAQLDEIGGLPADELRDTTPIPFRRKFAALTVPLISAEAAVHQFLLALTYGFTDDLEASVAVPVLYSDLESRVVLRFAGVRASDLSLVRKRFDVTIPEDQVGIGDILLRGKYRVLDTGPADVAAGLTLRVPTGDEDALQGVGFFEVAPGVLASSRVFEPAPWARLQGHFNVAVAFDTKDVSTSEARWGIGLDWGITDEVSAAVALLARHQFARIAPPGAFDFPRCAGTLAECAQDPTPRGSAPLFGLDGGRPDYYDLSLGGRGGLWRDTLFAFVNVLIPLNDGAVRTAPVPLVGLEATF